MRPLQAPVDRPARRLRWGGALFLGVSGVAALAGASAWMALFPALPRDLAGAEDLDRQAQHVRIEVAPRDSVDGWYLPGRNGATLLMFHGYGRMHDRMWRYAQFLRPAGYGMLTIDFRSSRARDRKPTTLGAYELPDAEAALAWLERRAPGERIGLFGESLGASVALMLAARHPEVIAIAADCPFASARLAIEESSERWLHVPRWPAAPMARWLGMAVSGHDPEALDVVPAAVALRERPLFFVACECDDRFSTAQSRSLWQAAGEKDTLWVVPDAGHNEAWLKHRERYQRSLLEFYALHLRPRPVPAG